MNTTLQTFNPYLTFPSTYLSNVPDPTNSPQITPNMTLDAVEIGVKSMLVGRLTSKTAVTSMQISQLQQKEASSLSLTASTVFKTAGKAGLISAGVSLGRNVYHLAKGEVNVSRASGNVGADLIGGTIGGMVAATGASLAVKAMSASSAMSMGTVGLIAGAVGFALADTIYHFTGLRDTVSNKITGMVERWFDADSQGGGV
ncbi:MAG TPA: hypothetical protein V6D23_28905 [Candidatus Obscuribacterales bacterium]